MDSVNVKLTRAEFDDMMMPLAKDMEALFNLMQDEVLELTKQAEKEGWTPEQLIKEVENMV